MGTGVQGVPVGFMHGRPIRSHHLRSRDLHASFYPSDVKASKMAGITTRFEVLPPLEEWHLNLEVGSQVYVLLGGFKQLQKATLWLDTMSLLHRGGFQNRVRENTPPGCYSSTSGKRVFSFPVCNLHLGEYERNNFSPYVLSFTRGGDRFWYPITEIGFTACQLKPRFVYFSTSGTGCT